MRRVHCAWCGKEMRLEDVRVNKFSDDCYCPFCDMVNMLIYDPETSEAEKIIAEWNTKEQ